MTRESVLDELAHAIHGIELPHPVRVAVDGVGASGKTTLADELVGPLEARGRTVIRASIDGFHRPRRLRYARGGDSPRGYLDDSFDHESLRDCVLNPLGPGGSLRYRTAVFDFRTDLRVEAPDRLATSESVLLFDGVFLLRRELVEEWDFRVFVDASFEVTLKRALERDLPLFGSEEAVRERYETRYIPGERLYLELHGPKEAASALVRNDDPENATLEWNSEAHSGGTE